ncbi:MAG: hypothetical protein R2729_25950 [Bryobacteraceae bacterium]
MRIVSRIASRTFIVAMPCGFDLGATARDFHFLAGRPGWRDLAPVRNRKDYLADGNQYFNRPGRA